MQGGDRVKLVEKGVGLLSAGTMATAAVVVYVFLQRPNAAWWQCCRVGDGCRLVSWYVGRLVGWLVGWFVG